MRGTFSPDVAGVECRSSPNHRNLGRFDKNSAQPGGRAANNSMWDLFAAPLNADRPLTSPNPHCGRRTRLALTSRDITLSSKWTSSGTRHDVEAKMTFPKKARNETLERAITSWGFREPTCRNRPFNAQVRALTR